VRNAACQRSDSLKLLGLPQLFFQLYALGYVLNCTSKP
jgi:hypothetical protein